LTVYNDSREYQEGQAHFASSMLVAELERMFASIPYENLLETILRDRTRAFSPLGRPGYPLEPMLRGLLASYYIPLRSTAQLARRLQDDPVLAVTCGFVPGDVPHRKAFSRFQKKLGKYQHLVDQCLNQMTTELKSHLPEFGKIVAIDCTPVRSYCNGDKEPHSDREGDWIVKEGSEKKKWVFGYRLHLIVDANWELPVAKKLSLAKDNEKTATIPLLRETKVNLPWFLPDAIIADKAYDKYEHYEVITKEFSADPIIMHAKFSDSELTGSPAAPHCPAGLSLVYRSWDKNKGIQYICPELARKATCPLPLKCGLRTVWVKLVHDYRRFGFRIERGTEEWKELYRKRVAVEHVNSRLKETRRLEAHCFRGYERINMHATLSVLVMQAVALAKAKAGQMDEIRVCVRQVG